MRGPLNPWSLPASATFDGETYGHKTDFRDILNILDILNQESKPLPLRWFRALAVFYDRPVSYGIHRQAMEYLADFLTMGQPEAPQPKLLDWSLDGPEIIEGVNLAAGRDIRLEGQVHWWTFLGWFHGIGEGRLSTLVAIRAKRLRGEKLTDWEQDYLRRNPHKFRPREDPEDRAEKARLEALLTVGDGTA